MKYLAQFSEKRIFDHAYVLGITKSRSLADETIQNYLKKNYIKRVKKNLYVTMSLENACVIPDKYEIASNISKSSYVSHHSAFEYYGYGNQVYMDVITSSMEKFRNFEFDGNEYKYKLSSDNEFVDTIRGVRVSTLAKTIVDCIDDTKSYDDLEDLLHNLSSLPTIDGNKILEYLHIKNKKILFSKVGLILDHFKDDVLLNDQMLLEMKHHGNTSIKYFNKEKHRLKKYYKEWKLYCYDINDILQEEN